MHFGRKKTVEFFYKKLILLSLSTNLRRENINILHKAVEAFKINILNQF
jgi:hypothetical protein